MFLEAPIKCLWEMVLVKMLLELVRTNFTCSSRTLLLHDVLHVLGIQHNLLSVIALISFCFSFEFSINGLVIFADGILYGHISFMDGFIKLDLNVLFSLIC